MVQFDSARHIYTVDGHRRPSVTEVIKATGYIEHGYFNEEARWRGSVVHRMTQLWDLGKLDESTVDPRVEGYLVAWKKYRARRRKFYSRIEEPIANQFMAGTPDRVGIGEDGLPCVDDIKTGAPQKWHALQLAGYAWLAHPAVDYCKRFAVYLQEDGEYCEEEFPATVLECDKRAFMACIETWNWRKAHGY